MEQNTGYPLVSVITAFYNEATFLNETILSVINQEYDNWELLLVDDGSTDESTLIAKKYAQLYQGKIFYLEHENHSNRSTAASRNLAITQSKGEFVAFLDADDVWRPAKLIRQVEIMRSDKSISMLVEASEYWSSWYKKTEKDIIVYVGKNTDRVFSPPLLAELLYPLGKISAPCPCAIMVTRDSLIRHEGFESGFKGNYQLYEDQAFLMKYYLHEKIYISSLCNNLYRQRVGSCVQRVRQEGNYHAVRKYFLNWLLLYIESHNIKDEKVNRLLRKAMDQYNKPLLYFFKDRLSRVQKKLSKMITPGIIGRRASVKNI